MLLQHFKNIIVFAGVVGNDIESPYKIVPDVFDFFNFSENAMVLVVWRNIGLTPYDVIEQLHMTS